MDMPCCLALQGVFHGWGRKLVPFIYLRFLHAVAGAVHPLGVLAGADPLGAVLDVRSFSAPRRSGLGGRQGEQGKDVPMGTEVPLGTKFYGNAIFVTTQSPKNPINAGKFGLCMPTEGPPLKLEREIQNPASSVPQKMPFSGDPFDPPDCSSHCTSKLVT